MTIQKITEKATCFFLHLVATVQHHLPTYWQHGWNTALAFPQQNHLDPENMQEKLVRVWYCNPRMFGGVWIIWALVKMFASHFQNRFQDKSPTVDIKTCLLHSVSVALSKQKKTKGQYRTTVWTQVCLLWLCCILYLIVFAMGGRKLPLLGWEASQSYFPFSRTDSFWKAGSECKTL